MFGIEMRKRTPFKSSISSELGAAFVELALTLGVLGAFASGLISAGLAYREAAVASDAARHAGRAGAAHASNYSGACLDNFEIMCEQASETGSTLNEATAFLACEFIDALALNSGNWSVSVSIAGPLVEDSLARYGLRVRPIRAGASDPGCAFCWSNIVASMQFQATEAFFLLEEDCL